MKKKELYSAPETEVLELRLEGVIAASEVESGDGMLPGWGDGGSI